ncbi:Aste57867_8238 [Aphanomyces stellatus]|uniref:Aste57867_8238 protein n=1 Tax=Aphanomyces stellatus TaxID=120398 RepID=A0A485KJR2_9STRA|nr:hypothetical protein As57867_008207 [Aphanomyces stellatus]VFT85125.1 Aste57867_8238 [Aphanomyces stellatus]
MKSHELAAPRAPSLTQVDPFDDECDVSNDDECDVTSESPTKHILPAQTRRCLSRRLALVLIGSLTFAVVALSAACIALLVRQRSAFVPVVYDGDSSSAQQPILLFLGDSNTEYSSRPDLLGWQVRFTADYVRRADVINRGAAGWNTGMWVLYLPTLLAEWAPKPPTLVLVMLGTNDASPSNLNVAIDDYQANLQTLVEGIQTSWRSRVLLATPLPVDESAPAQRPRPTHSNAESGQYASAMLQVGARLNVPVLDLWTPLQPNRSILFVDGVHLSRVGNIILHAMFQDKIANVFPDLSPTNITRLYSFGDRR